MPYISVEYWLRLGYDVLLLLLLLYLLVELAVLHVVGKVSEGSTSVS
jgi:hypothetical protein